MKDLALHKGLKVNISFNLLLIVYSGLSFLDNNDNYVSTKPPFYYLKKMLINLLKVKKY